MVGLAAVDKIESNVHMYVFSPNVGYGTGNHDTALLFGPAGYFAQEAQRIGLYAYRHVLTLIAANFLHACVSGPGAEWDLV